MQRNVTLEKVIGLTAKSNASLACDPNNDLVAYPAGCTVVLLNTRRGHQSHLLNTSRKTVVCLAYSADGKFLVTGECGHQPALRVWDMSQPSAAPVAELMGHKYGVNCVAFSPNMRYIVSVGTQHDMIVNVWDWRVGVKVASNKVSAKVKAVAFSENGSYFVTVGNRNVKFWYLEHSRFTKYKEAVPLMGRSAILGEQRNNYFNDVACGKGAVGDYTFATTKSGMLCEFNNRRLLDKWVDLKTNGAHCLAVGLDIIVVGCNDGIIRCFNPHTLQFVSTLPRPHFNGVDVAQALNIMHLANQMKDVTYPDTISIVLDEVNSKVVSIYSDHSIYVWDIKDIRRVGKSHSFLYHSACIWGVEMYPSGEHNSDMAVPPGCFVTCSSDNSIRFWNVDSSNQPINPAFRNIYSDELIKTIYIEPSAPGQRKKTDSSGQKEYDGQNGVRSVRISPDGQHMASGDREGNIRIYDMMTFEEVCRIEAHDAEVLCLEFSPTATKSRLLASASRDRLIHVFDADRSYSFMQTLDDHSASITAVKFLCQGSRLWLASCGADKTIIFRHLQPGNPPMFVRDHIIVGKTTLYDMEAGLGDRQVVTACQDRNIRVFDVSTGKLSKSYKGSYAEEGSLIKVVVDHRGKYIASSCTDKTLCLIDYATGECISTMSGHSELVTGLKFTEDGKYLVSASGDSCMFVWRLPQFMAPAEAPAPQPVPVAEAFNVGQLLGQLPPWAAKQSRNEFSSLTSQTKQIEMPKGRWAQKLDPATGIRNVNSFSSMVPTGGSSGGSNSMVFVSGGEDSQSMPAEYHSLSSEPPAKLDAGTYEAGVDGDVEDCSDGEPPGQLKAKGVVYYPNQEDSNSEYTIRSLDVTELLIERRNQSDYVTTDSPSNSKFGSPDSDMDDGASTPSTNEPTEKNFPSLLSGSTESLDKTDYEDRFVKTNFDSLSGADAPGGTGTSLSSKFLTQFNNARNLALVNAARQTKEDLNSTRKREELQKRIEATRQKLHSVGFRAPLTNSQSSMDLRKIGENTRFISSLSRAKPTKDEGGGGLRRSISLSNLNAPNKPAEKGPDKHHLGPDYGPLMDKLSHCASYEVLYQVDDRPSRRNSVSSLNKSKPLSSSRRNKKLSASTDNISRLGGDGEYSSSEEAVKQARRLPSREQTASPLTLRNEGLTDRRAASPATSVATENITKELCLRTGDLLERSAEALMQLHRRVTAEVGSAQSGELLQVLATAAGRAQRTLQAATVPEASAPDAQPPMQGDMVLIMQQYSDMLVSMVQQQIASNPA